MDVSTQTSETSASLLPADETERDQTSSSHTGCSGVRLFTVLCKTYGSVLIGSALLKLVYDLLQFVGPVILQKLILYLQESSESDL